MLVFLCNFIKYVMLPVFITDFVKILEGIFLEEPPDLYFSLPRTTYTSWRNYNAKLVFHINEHLKRRINLKLTCWI